jgi:hypothetical protein
LLNKPKNITETRNIQYGSDKCLITPSGHWLAPRTSEARLQI